MRVAVLGALLPLGGGIVAGPVSAQDSAFQQARAGWRAASSVAEKVAVLEAMRATAGSAPAGAAVITALALGLKDPSAAVKVRAIELIAADPDTALAADGLQRAARELQKQLQASVKPLRPRKDQPVLETLARLRTRHVAAKDRMAAIKKLAILFQPGPEKDRGLAQVKEYEEEGAVLADVDVLETARRTLLTALSKNEQAAAVAGLEMLLADAPWNDDGVAILDALLARSSGAVLAIVANRARAFDKALVAEQKAEKAAAKFKVGRRPKDTSEEYWARHQRKVRLARARQSVEHQAAMMDFAGRVTERLRAFATAHALKTPLPVGGWMERPWQAWFRKAAAELGG